jgi:GrpB-like predicted nucleotidyltransferase (UPF0157 family)
MQWPAWATEPVRVVEPDPRWPEQAELFAAEARRLLADELSGSIEHVGSTAVPGLPAKPLIDLQASADDPAAVIAAMRDALAAASWFVVPRELDGRPRRWFVVRADLGLAQEYARLTTQATVEHAHDREAYTEVKQAFIRHVLGQSR